LPVVAWSSGAIPKTVAQEEVEVLLDKPPAGAPQGR
jgi:hypothetical protein